MRRCGLAKGVFPGGSCEAYSRQLNLNLEDPWLEMPTEFTGRPPRKANNP